MPTTWNRSPEEFHKIYIANTDAFYRIGSSSLAEELDKFVTQCALGLWSRAGGVTQRHVDMANQIYSKNRPKPQWLLWTLTSSVCESEVFLPPVFFWDLAESDAKRGRESSRTFIRMLTNILLYLAATDDDVTYAEAEYITECTDKLTAICDTSGVRKSKEALNPLDYVTSGEPSFTEKHGLRTQSAGGEEKSAQGKTEEQPRPSLEELVEQLDALVGLDEVKKDVKSLVNLMKVRKLRQENGLPVPPMSLHMVFMGNPGTGKTTVARLISGLYAAIGVLSKGQLVEVDRSGLVAGFVGQTAIKTNEAVQKALGGVLFIDEAYALVNQENANDFGHEAIEVLLKNMEDHRKDLIVIVAGYTELMGKFIHSNPGLESRFNKYFYFEDYTGEQLMEILRSMCAKNGYTLDAEAEKLGAGMLRELYEERDENFGNARDVRNLFEKAVARQADRVALLEAPTREDLMALTAADLREPEERAEAGERA